MNPSEDWLQFHPARKSSSGSSNTSSDGKKKRRGRPPKARPVQVSLGDGGGETTMRAELESEVGAAMEELSRPVLQRLAAFLSEPANSSDGALRTAVLELGANYGHDPGRSMDALLECLGGSVLVLRLSSAQAPNMKKALHSIAQGVVTLVEGSTEEMLAVKRMEVEDSDDEGESVFRSSPRKRRRRRSSDSSTDSEEDEDEATENIVTEIPPAKGFLTLSDLSRWLGQSFQKTELILLLEDMESFSPIVLNELVPLLHRECLASPSLHIRLLLGLRTADFAVGAILGPAGMACLRPKTFQFPAPEACLARALETAQRWLWERQSLLLSPGLLRSLVEEFRMEHLSWHGLLRRLAYALHRHCCRWQRLLPLLRDGPASLDDASAKEVLALASVSGRSGDEWTSHPLREAAEKVAKWASAYPTFLAAFYRCVSPHPDFKIGRSRLELELALAEENFFESGEAWTETKRLWSQWSREEMENLIRDLTEIIKVGPDANPLQALGKVLAERGADLGRLEEMQARLDAEAKRKPLSPAQTGRASRHSLQAALKARIERRTETDAFCQQRQRLLAFLARFFAENLRHAAKLPLFELAFIPVAEDAFSLRRHIPAALVHDSSGHDTALLHRLIRTTTAKTLSTTELFGRFQAELSGDLADEEEKAKFSGARKAGPKKTPAKKPSKKEKDRPGQKAEFFLALAELELCGFVKAMERRPGTIQRLWGADNDAAEDQLRPNLAQFSLND